MVEENIPMDNKKAIQKKSASSFPIDLKTTLEERSATVEASPTYAGTTV